MLEYLVGFHLFVGVYDSTGRTRTASQNLSLNIAKTIAEHHSKGHPGGRAPRDQVHFVPSLRAGSQAAV